MRSRRGHNQAVHRLAVTVIDSGLSDVIPSQARLRKEQGQHVRLQEQLNLATQSAKSPSSMPLSRSISPAYCKVQPSRSLHERASSSGIGVAAVDATCSLSKALRIQSQMNYECVPTLGSAWVMPVDATPSSPGSLIQGPTEQLQGT